MYKNFKTSRKKSNKLSEEGMISYGHGSGLHRKNGHHIVLDSLMANSYELSNLRERKTQFKKNAFIKPDSIRNPVRYLNYCLMGKGKAQSKFGHASSEVVVLCCVRNQAEKAMRDRTTSIILCFSYCLKVSPLFAFMS